MKQMNSGDRSGRSPSSLMIIMITLVILSGCGGGSTNSFSPDTSVSPSAPTSPPPPTTRNYYKLTTAQYPSNLKSRNGYLFWSENSQTPINKILIADGNTIPLANRIGFINDYVIDGQYVYWIDTQSRSFGKCYIKKSSIDGNSDLTPSIVPVLT